MTGDVKKIYRRHLRKQVNPVLFCRDPLMVFDLLQHLDGRWSIESLQPQMNRP